VKRWDLVSAPPYHRVSGFPVDASPVISEPASSEGASHALALWRTLLEASADGVLVVGPQGRILAANPAFCRLFALQQPAGSLSGVALGELAGRLGGSFADTAHFLGRTAELHRHDDPVAGESWTMSDGRVLECDVLPVLIDGRRTDQLCCGGT